MCVKSRLDVLLVERGLVESRSKAQAIIMAGDVRINGEMVTKAGMQVSSQANVTIKSRSPYVSRGAFKLVAALDNFAIVPNNAICADVGASTGGFTDLLLERQAARVYAIDVGYGQLAWSLRQNEQVVVMERTNARYLDALPEPIRLVTIDVSFISLRLILPTVRKWLAETADVIALIKPQFEAGKHQVGKKGIVRDSMVHQQVLKIITSFAIDAGFMVLGLIPSPITGATGNHEFLVHLGWQTTKPTINLPQTIQYCLDEIHLENKG